MRTIYFDVAYADDAVCACMGDIHPQEACFGGRYAGFGDGRSVGRVAAYCGPRLAIEACLDGEIAVVELWSKAGRLGMTHHITAYEERLLEVKLHPACSVGSFRYPHILFGG